MASSENTCPHGTRYTDFTLGPSCFAVIGQIQPSRRSRGAKARPDGCSVSSVSTSNFISTTSRSDFTRPHRISSQSALELMPSTSSPGSRNWSIASLLYRFPTESDTIGRDRDLCESGQVVQQCSCCSRWVSFTCAVVGARAASRTSSRRVGILESLV